MSEQPAPSAEAKLKILQNAVTNGNIERVIELLSDLSVASIVTMGQFASFLRNAVMRRNINMVRTLLAHKPNLNPVSNINLLSPLWISILYNYYEIAEILIRAGANVNERLGPHFMLDHESSFLHVLAMDGPCDRHECLIDMLIDFGADVNAKDSKGQTVLHYAATCGMIKTVDKLLVAGANPNVADNQGETVLHVAAYGTYAEQLVPMLLKKKADPKARDQSGMNALHYLASSSKESLTATKMLIDKGTSLHDCEIITQYTPLHFAVMNGKEDTVTLFIEEGADINAKTKAGTFPLYLSAKCESTSMINILLSKGAKVNERTNKGRTALHSACRSVTERNIHLLLEFGADVNIKDEEGNTPFSLIEFKNMNPSIRVVIRKFAKLIANDELVNQKDFEILKEYPKLQAYYDNCLKELVKMKEHKIYDEHTIFSILTKSQEKLSKLTKNLDYVIAFKKCDRQGLFPIYAKELNHRFECAQKKKDMTFSLENKLTEIFTEVLPDTVIRRLVYFLVPRCICFDIE